LIQIKELAQRVKDCFGVKLSNSTLKQWLKKWNFKWKRLRKSAKSRRNEIDFQFFKSELAILRDMEQIQEIDLYYFDEMGVNLNPSIPYAWQPIGKTVEIPATQSQNLTVLGFINKANHFVGHWIKGGANAELVVKIFDDFAVQIKRKTVVVLDNCPTHKSKIFIDKIKTWRTQGLLIQFIPAYCPELNKIEILWREFKHRWIAPEAYKNIQSLENQIVDILGQIGKKYRITFS
jgi:transposase